MEKTLTIKQLSQLTGLENRTLQFWTVNGVLECDPETRHGGPGKPRRYPQDEAVVALMLSEIIRMPLQVGALREIAERFREIMNYGPENGVTDPVLWETSDGGHKMMEEASKLKKEGELYRELKLVEKYYGLQTWCWLQFAILGIRSYISRSGKRQPIGDYMLELAVDDTGRWQLAIHHAGHYRDEETDTEAPPVWSLRLVLNLTRTFARLQPPREPNFAAGAAPEGGRA